MDTFNKLLALILVVAIALIAYWQFTYTPPSGVGVYTPGKVPPVVSVIPKVKKTPKDGVKVYSPIAKKLLDLPKEVKGEIVAATIVPSDIRSQTVVTTVDLETGEFSTIVRRDPYKFFSVQKRGEISISYDFSTISKDFVYHVSYKEDFFQVKALHFGVSADIYSSNQVYAGLRISYKW